MTTESLIFEISYVSTKASFGWNNVIFASISYVLYVSI